MAPTNFLRHSLLSPSAEGDSILSRRADTVAKPWKPHVLPGSDRLFVPSFREITRRSDGDDGLEMFPLSQTE